MLFSLREPVFYGKVQGLRVGRFNFGVNTSFVVYRVGSTWIDAGPPNRWRQIREFAMERPVENLLLTHHHEDHSGNARDLQQLTGCQLLAPALSLPLLRTGFPIQFYRRQVWGVPPRCQAQALPEVFEDPQGYRWQVIPTPGHADDMVCLFEASNAWLFSADLYVASRIRYGRKEDCIRQELESIRKVLDLPFEHLFCAHRGKVENGRQALQSKYDYLTDLRQRVIDLHHKGYSLRRIQRQLLGFEDHVSLLSGFHFCKSHLIRACLN